MREPVYLLAESGRPYAGSVTLDPYGRPQPKYAHGTANLDRWTSSARRIVQAMMDLFDRIADPDLTVRRVNVAACSLLPEDQIPRESARQLDLFTDYVSLEKQEAAEAAADAKERKLQLAALSLQDRFGKNALLKAMNLQEGATARLRNSQIGGHRAGDLPQEPSARNAEPRKEEEP